MYRFLKHKVRHLDYLLKDLDSGNVCPACPQVCHEIPPFLCTLNTVCIHNDCCSYIHLLRGNLELCGEARGSQIVWAPLNMYLTNLNHN